jgi:hypothetical protein
MRTQTDVKASMILIFSVLGLAIFCMLGMPWWMGLIVGIGLGSLFG